MATRATFHAPEDKSEWRKRFTDELSAVANADWRVQQLLKVLKTHGRHLTVQVFVPDDESDPHVVVMIVGRNDRVLMQLGREHGFPRGFPILWRPQPRESTGPWFRFFGFLPKFANDEQRCVAEGYSTLVVCKKWSGYLGMLFGYEFAGSDGSRQLRYVVTSKNSAVRSLYSDGLADVLSSMDMAPVVDDMIDKCVHVCGEVLSKKDQTHGARVSCDAFVVTSMLSGFAVWSTSADRGRSDKFVSKVPAPEMADFCARHSLSVDSWYQLRGPEAIGAFNDRLLALRDFACDASVQALLDEHTEPLIQGTVRHRDVLGDVLEGLVMHYSEPGSLVLKYKFPRYTFRTMFLRPMLDGATPTVEGFVRFWVASERGKRLFRRLALAATDDRLQEAVADEEGVGRHILLAEAAERKVPVQAGEDDPDAEEGTLWSPDVVLVLGPQGCGKSTVGRWLEAESGGAMRHIDGDTLLLGEGAEEIVKSMGQERNEFTRWQVMRALMDGKVPVLSCCGGWQVCDRDAPVIADEIAAAFGCGPARLHVLAPRDEAFDEGTVRDTLRWRIDNHPSWKGLDREETERALLGWALEKTTERVRMFKARAASVGVFSLDGERVVFDPPLPPLSPVSLPAVPRFNQERLLVRLPCGRCKHVTVLYGKKEPFDARATSAYEWYAGRAFRATHLTYAKRGAGTFNRPRKFELLKVHVDGGPFEYEPRAGVPLSHYAHVTINPGPYPAGRMREVALLVHGGADVALAERDGGLIEYDRVSEKEVDVRVVSGFCIA
jgi:hypothetical protein